MPEVTPKYIANPKFRAVAGERYWCALVHGEDEPAFVPARTHFRNHRYFYCTEGECCRRLGPPKVRGACALLIYNMIKDSPTPHAGWVVRSQNLVPWVFGVQAYNKIEGIVSNWPRMDFAMTCKMPQYQNVEAIPCGRSTLYQGEKTPDVCDVLFKYQAVRKDAVKWMAMDLSPAQIHDVLSGALKIKNYKYGDQIPERPGLTRYQIALMRSCSIDHG